MAWWNKPKEDETEATTKPTEPTPPPPQYATVDQFNQITESVNKLNQLAESLTNARGYNPNQNTAQGWNPASPASQATHQPEEPAIEDVSDEQIVNAWAKADETGEAADIRAARALEAKRNNANLERIRREGNKKVKELETQGQQWVGNVNQQLTMNHLAGKKWFKDYQKDIEQVLSQVPTAQWTPQVGDAVYNYVIGTKYDEIRTKEVEMEARASADHIPDMPTRSGRGRQETKQPGAKFSEVFGDSVSQSNARWDGGGHLWAGRHRNPDEFANNLGYGGADDYAQAAERIMSIEDCPHCFSPMVEADHKCRVASSTHHLNIPGVR